MGLFGGGPSHSAGAEEADERLLRVFDADVFVSFATPFFAFFALAGDDFGRDFLRPTRRFPDTFITSLPSLNEPTPTEPVVAYRRNLILSRGSM